MLDGARAAQCFKKKVLGGYVRTLHRLDPQLATHLLKAHKSAFEAGRAFFEEEIRHAERALEKVGKER